MKHLALLLLVPLLACSGGRRTTDDTPETPGCQRDGDCGVGQVCFQAQCVEAPSGYGADSAAAPAKLRAAPTTLSFGGVAKTLPITLTNDGAAPIELSMVQISPAGSVFRLETTGDGPFWIRAGRSRDVLVTYVPSQGGATQATLTVQSPAPALGIALSAN